MNIKTKAHINSLTAYILQFAFVAECSDTNGK